MQVLKCLLVFCMVYAYAKAQDYQDYQDNAPRQAPIRLRSNPGLAEHTRPTPVPILKQINKHNEDGSYTYGFEGADGSFKIETKLATGEVKGKYGYVDETGKVRVVEYGANKYGFQPSGEGITVAPPTLVDETRQNDLPDYEDEPQVRPQRPHRVNRPQQQQQYRPVPQQPRQQPQYVQYDDEEAEPEPPRRVQYATVAPQQVQPQYQRASAAPVPPRIQVAGAQRISDVLYTASPRPERPHFEYSQSTSFGDAGGSVRVSRPSYAPAPAPPAPSSARAQGFLGPASGGRPHLEPFQYGPTQPSSPAQSAPQPRYHQPQPQPQSQPQPQPQPQFQSRSGGSSLLDQLARDYALPENSAQPLHDISFGYYQ